MFELVKQLKKGTSQYAVSLRTGTAQWESDADHLEGSQRSLVKAIDPRLSIVSHQQ
jgi:hypothetical protein